MVLRWEDGWLFVLAPFNLVYVLLPTRLSLFVALDVVTCVTSLLDLRITCRCLFLLLHNG